MEGQATLFGDVEDENRPLLVAPVIHIKEHQRPLRKKGDREKLTEGLAREMVECVLNPGEVACTICGSDLKVIGKKKVRSEMEYIPARLVMKDYVQYVYKCVECGKSDENPYDAIYSAPVPAPVLMHSIASDSCAAWIMYQKYVLSVPFYRQERDFLRLGAAL